MNIIILAKNYGNYRSGYYHQDIINSFNKVANCYIYGEGYPHYNLNDDIYDVISKSPFDKSDIDLIAVSTTWEIQDESIEDSDPHPKINMKDVDIPKIFFLNKEYKKIDKKLEYIIDNTFDFIYTAHHDYKKWEEITDLKFIHLPFAADHERFKDHKLSRKYDFGFTGSLHRSYTDLRYKIKHILFKNPNIRSNLGLSAIFKKNPLKNEFRKYKIYWAEWGTVDIFGRSLLPVGSRYINFLNSFKTFLSTPSSAGLIGTRYYECMATKTLIFCPESEYYEDIFNDGVNCVMFKKDLSDFKQKLEYILLNEDKRQEIVENAFNEFIKNHTYDHRIEKVLKGLGAVI